MIIDLKSDLYPQKLKEIYNAPKRLYVKGNLKNLNTNCISIIGSRHCTEYGKKWCEIFVKELIQYNLTIVSGMATGIDTIAHVTTIENYGNTIAVLPCGLENIYPKENITLYKNIIENGGTIISEYLPKQEADSNKFIERNRIVSGLSIATLVVEAAYRSGTSITAKQAKTQNRDVFCIPGSLDNKKSIGTNNLIKEFAKIVTKPEDIIINYPFLKKVEKVKKNSKKMYDIPEEYRDIYQILTEQPIDINDIVKCSNSNFKDIIYKLTILELEGKVKKLPGNRYKRR